MKVVVPKCLLVGIGLMTLPLVVHSLVWIWVGAAAGYLLLRAGQLDEAEKTFQTLLESDPESADAALGLATVYTARRGIFLAKAELLANKVIGHDPKYARAHFVTGLIYRARGDSEHAADSFQKASQLLLDASDPDIKVAP